MADTKIIAVMGATGAQGGGLVRAIQADPASGFIARAITRDANSDAAKQLAALGAEIVEANIDDGPSIARAFEGAHGAFCVTFYWAHMNPEREIAEAHTLADAAKQAGVKHAIWSTLEDTRKWVPLESDQMPTIHDHYKVPHFDTKGESNRFFH
ncbi:MAG TPA: NmrA family NAD(P)-binding protein, partial [Vitreimonas sp.]|nr:NmrA family NAD(P)-binding protein [Vitreimonas sp.]